MTYLKSTLLLLLSICAFVNLSAAQAEDETTKTILAKDALFWNGYNTCNYEQMGEFVADDVEFYHDKGGITSGKPALIDSIRKNLCSNPSFHTRREAVSGTVKVFPLKNSNVVYGAIISGRHYFFNTHDDKPEKREGVAGFTQLWLLKDGIWKMSRILSYDHDAAPFENTRIAMELSKNELKRFAGQYSGAKSGILKITAEDGDLKLIIGSNEYTFYAETKNRFFVKDRDLTFEFLPEKGKPAKIVIRENGEIVEEAKVN